MLTDKEIKGLTPRSKPYRVADAQSMVVHVAPTGSRSFRLRYRIPVGDALKERELTLGKYPAMTIREAREKAAEARVLIGKGLDPSQQRRVAVAAAAATTAATFGAVFALLAADKKKRRKNPDGRPHATYMNTAEKYLLKPLAGIPLADITAMQIRGIIAKVYAQVPGTGATCLRIIGQVFVYAKGHDLFKGDNPAANLTKDFPRPRPINQPSVRKCASIGEVLTDINTLGFFPRSFLWLIALTFSRFSELRLAYWSEFDLDAGVWTVPESRMKMGREHKVPLSRQAVAILRELYAITGKTCIVFPAINRCGSEFMSESTVSKALSTKLGWAGEHSTHGFRGTAATVLKECRFDKDAVLLSIAHWSAAKGDSTEQAYDSATLLPYRQVMLQGYADYLDRLVAGEEKPLRKLKIVRVELRDSLDEDWIDSE